MKNLILRTITGIVYVALLVGCVISGPIGTFAFFSIVAMAALWEFGTILNKNARTQLCRPINSLAGLVLSGAVWLSCVASPTSSKAFALYGLTLLYLIIRELYLKHEDPLRNWAFSFASQIYIALPLSLVSLIYIYRDTESGNITFNWIYLLSLFVFLWINDTGAYLSGLCLHNVFPTKLFPRISPKKTWVGSIGGGILTLAASAAIWKLCQTYSGETEKISFWIGLALVVVIFGTWGDLVESLLKRQLDIKDSGHILPGHGGILDRFDSCLLAIPAAIAYIYLMA